MNEGSLRLSQFSIYIHRAFDEYHLLLMNLFHFIHSTLEGCLLAKQLLYVAQFSESLVSISSHDSH